MQCSAQKITIAVLLTGSLTVAEAGPCDRADQHLTAAQTAGFSRAVGAQLEVASAQILHSYRLGNWYLLYADPRVTDDTFLFYRGDPESHRYLAAWSGRATHAEQARLRDWARDHARGVPETLAKCFAYVAVTRRNR